MDVNRAFILQAQAQQTQNKIGQNNTKGGYAAF